MIYKVYFDKSVEYFFKEGENKSVNTITILGKDKALILAM